MASLSLVLPIFARCERPSAASTSAFSDQPGRFAQGPDEKLGLAGRTAGFAIVVMLFLSSQIARVSLGRRGPLTGIAESAFFLNTAFGEYFHQTRPDCSRREELHYRLKIG